MKNTILLIFSFLSLKASAQSGLDGNYSTGFGLTGFELLLGVDYSFRIDSRTCFGTYVDTGIYEFVHDTLFFHSTLEEIDSLDLLSFKNRRYNVRAMTDSPIDKMLYRDDNIYFIRDYNGQEWILNVPLKKEK